MHLLRVVMHLSLVAKHLLLVMIIVLSLDKGNMSERQVFLFFAGFSVSE